MVDDARLSYTAANVFPVKLFHNLQLMRSIVREKYIPPVHVQLNPTNHCNFNCGFCSCGARNTNLELDYPAINNIMLKFHDLECQSATITGGGEPLCHKQIGYVLTTLKKVHRINLGLVTNGSLLMSIRADILDLLTWIRISSANTQEYRRHGVSNPNSRTHLAAVVNYSKTIDWSFSHVVTSSADIDIIKDVVRFANVHRFTHVRLVSDLLNLEKVPPMDDIKSALLADGIDDVSVIYQGRKQYTKGAKNCYISLLKPVVGADGYLYPCCGVQYALENPSKDYEKSMRMGDYNDIDRIWRDQVPFDGSNCVKCYYSEYNNALDLLLKDIHHVEFI